MANIFDYLNDVAYDSFYDLPVNELDVLALTELTYLPFDDVVTQEPKRLIDLAPQIPRDTTMLTNKNRLQLLDQLSQHKRFKNCKLSNFINDIDPELQKQFAAMTYRISLDTYLLVFRGTDDSIIGWKEDFHMTYMKEIPAQKHSLQYLENFFAQHPNQKVILAGHSKGGNLAVYAASQLDPNLQKNIVAVYTFDSPGLHKELTETPGYQNMMERTKVFVPQGSIIGMMLEIPDKKIVVRSTSLGGLAQHDTFSWQVEDKHFVQLDTTFKEWVETVPDEELQLYFDLFFGIILDAGISSINDLSSFKVIEHIHHLFVQAQSLTPEERETMGRLTQLLIDTRYQAWKNRV